MGLFGGGGAGLLSGVTDLGGGLVGGAVDTAIGVGGGLGAAYLQKEWARGAASSARHWQEMMRATAYQTTVEDLKKAGLNPLLAVSQGPTGTPGVQVADVPNVNLGTAGGVMSSVRQGAMLKAGVDRARSEAAIAKNAEMASDAAPQKAWADVDAVQSAASASRASAGLAEAQRHRANTEAVLNSVSSARQAQTMEIERAMLPEARAKFAADSSEFQQKVLKFNRQVRNLGDAGAAVGSPITKMINDALRD